MIILDARLANLSSPELLAALDRTAAEGREVTADLVALLAECDARQLYVAEGYASLFDFCVARLRLSEAQAYHRIQAARAARRFSLVLERLRAGRVTLTAVALLREHLTEDNHRAVLDWADGRGKREVEVFVRGIDPKPDVPASLRRLAPRCARQPVALAAERHGPAPSLGVPSSDPARTEPPTDASLPLLTASPTTVAATAKVACDTLEPLAPSRSSACETPAQTTGAALIHTGFLLDDTAPAHRAEIRPLAPTRYSLRVTISQETHDKLLRAQDLLSHSLPSTDPALVLDRALTVLVEQLERRKAGAPRKAQHAARPAAPAKATAGRPKAMRATGNSSGTTGHRVAPTREGVGADTNEPGKIATATGVGTSNRVSQGAAPVDATDRRRGRSRYIPAAIRRAVWDRDGARCAYVSANGVRCSAAASLEYHHRVPFGEGGASTLENLALACTRHNALEANRWFNFDRAEFEDPVERRLGSRRDQRPRPGGRRERGQRGAALFLGRRQQ